MGEAKWNTDNPKKSESDAYRLSKLGDSTFLAWQVSDISHDENTGEVIYTFDDGSIMRAAFVFERPGRYHATFTVDGEVVYEGLDRSNTC